MKTVYILKNCSRSIEALIEFYKEPDISTNIIILDEIHAKILLLDKRVKEFPLIINSLPTELGLIPKDCKVLPLRYFMDLRNNNKEKKNKKTKKYSNREIKPMVDSNVTIVSNNVPVTNNSTQIKTNRSILQERPTHVINRKISLKKPKKTSNISFYRKKNKNIKRIPQKDGGVDIILE